MDRRSFLMETTAAVGAVALAQPLRPPETHSTLRTAVNPHPSLSFRFVASDPTYFYGRPCYSPDGRTVLFQRAPASADPAGRISNFSDWSFWSVPATGGSAVPVFEHGEIRATRPDWSWNTDLIAFSAIRSGRGVLAVVDSNGENFVEIPVGTSDQIFYPSWYPDGRSVAVTDFNTHQVLRIDVGSGKVEPLTDPGEVWAGMCSVSPDVVQTPVAFAGQRPNGSFQPSRNMVWVQHGGQAAFALDGEPGRMPWWSPQGTHLAFSSSRPRQAPAPTVHRRHLHNAGLAIYVQRVRRPNGPHTVATAVTPLDHDAAFPKWSPDGRQLVCVASSRRTGENGIAIVALPAAVS